MKINQNVELQVVPGKFLTQVLGQSEQIQELIEQSVEELSTANTGIKQETGSAYDAACECCGQS